MSALARYFFTKGYRVGGYDRTPSALTRTLEREGMAIIYEDQPELLADWAQIPQHCLVVRTPAVPEDNRVYQYFVTHNYDIRKRAEVLGIVTRQKHALCVAGTHGKTTTSTLLAHILHVSHLTTDAFLGGISENYKTNLLLESDSDFVVVEADEYDRSFHHLSPYMSIITSVDPDHLDIYGTAEAYRESFEHYSSLVKDTLLVKYGAHMTPRGNAKVYTYAGEYNGQEPTHPDFYATNIVVRDGSITFDMVTPSETIAAIRLGVPVWVNIENGVAAMAIAWMLGVRTEELRSAMQSFRGVQRRFNVHIQQQNLAYVDDYAHHPTELQASIESIRRVWKDRHLIAVFQPHLYTRTRDFADDFARVLSTADELVLLPIYPARELPIAGVSSEMLLAKCLSSNPNCTLVEKADLVAHLRQRVAELDKPTVIMTLGAGDIDRLVTEIQNQLAQ